MKINIDIKISLILFLLSILGVYLWINEIYLKIPVLFGFDIDNHNFFISLIVGLILLLIWIVVECFVFLFSLISLFAIFATTILMIISIFTKGKMFGGYSSNKRLLNLYSDKTYVNGISNSNIKYDQKDLEKIEETAIFKGILAPGKRGEYIDKKTGKFKEDCFFDLLNKDTDCSIDLNTGKYIEKDILGIDVETGKKIDMKTGEFYKDDILFGYQKTDSRVNQESGIIEEKGLFGWEETNERVNPKTGKRQNKDWLGNWNDIDD